MEKEHERKVYYIIADQIKSWRKFGRVIGVEDHVINNIEKDYHGDKYEMAYRCIANKRETSKEVIDWSYWRKILLELNEVSIINKIENEYSYLSAGKAEEALERKVCFIISDQIKSWRKLGRAIGVEDRVIKNIAEDYHGDNYEMAYRCISNKRETSKEVFDWPYWRKILLELDEGSIIDTIEKEYPSLSIEEVHKCFKDEDHLAIVAHNASRKENFLLFHCDLKEEIQLYFGTGETQLSIIMRREKLQEKLFEEHGFLLEDCTKFMFSNNCKEECDVLNTAHDWLSGNNDGGFAIKGYDMKHHLQYYTGIYPCENPYKDSYVLVYSVNHNVIIHIDTDPEDINTAVKNNRMDISYLRTLHRCIVGKAILFVIVTLYDDDKFSEVVPDLCESCDKIGLVVRKNIFKNLSSLKNWWQRIEDKNKDIRKLVNKSNEVTDLTKDLIKSIIEFMVGVTSFEVPNFTKSPRFQSRTIQDDNQLLMLHPGYNDVSSSMQQLSVN